MLKTGRNDPCQCGSGKKYKKCCLGKAVAAQSQTLPQYTKSPLKEETAFQLLLRDSQPFRKYYAEVRPELTNFVVVLDPGLPPGVRARTTRSDGKKYLRLRTPICPLEHAVLLAHELGHFLQDERGFPSVGGLNDHQAAAALNSALHDPLIDASLASYGFDSSIDQANEVEESIRQLSAIPRAPVDSAGKAHWIANCLGHILSQHVLGVNSADDKFLQWFTERHPSIAHEAECIAAEVISIGFETPEKMFIALEIARTMLGAGGGVIGPPRKSN